MRRFYKFFLQQDRFAEPVTVNYEGDGEFKTCGGACFSFLTYLIVATFAALQLIALVNLDNTTIQSTVEYKNY